MSKVEKFPPQFNDPSDRDDQDPETKKENRLEQLTDVRKKLSRKTVTIYEYEFKEWEKMKPKGMTWTGLFHMVRVEFEKYNKLFKKISPIIYPYGPQPVNSNLTPYRPRPPSKPTKNSELNVNSRIVQKRSIKKQLLDEFNSHSDIRSILKPMKKKELKKIQYSAKEISDKEQEATNRAIRLHKKWEDIQVQKK